MIDAELRRFCEDENAFFFKVSDYTDAIVGDNGFFKIKMAPTVIAFSTSKLCRCMKWKTSCAGH